MTKRTPSIVLSTSKREPAAFTIAELESGLRSLDESDLDQVTFWDEHIAAFRQTVLIAIRDTSDALLSAEMPCQWRLELEAQLMDLLDHLELANRYLAIRSSDEEDPAYAPAFGSMIN